MIRSTYKSSKIEYSTKIITENSEIATMPEKVFENETILTFQDYVCGRTNWP